MRLRYAGVCRLCGTELPARAEAIYEPSTKTVRCPDCPPADQAASAEPVEVPAPIEVGTPGASARREFQRRQAKRQERIRAKHPRLGGLILAVSDDAQSTTAWDTGAVGEERLGNRLNKLSSDTLGVLHDRRIPRSRANIDHLAVTATGVYVIDAKRYKGRPRLKVEGGILRSRTEKLFVGSRERTKLVDGVLEQVSVVRSIVGNAIPIMGVLCFIEADWPLLGGSFTVRGVDVLWPKKLYPRLSAGGPLDVGHIASLHRLLADALPPA